MMFMSVLTLWGQTETSNNMQKKWDNMSIKDKLVFLKDSSEVILNAYRETEKNEYEIDIIRKDMDHLFDLISKIDDNYKEQFKDNNYTEEYKENIERYKESLKEDFVNDYSKAALNEGKNKISIQTILFYKVIKTFIPKYELLNILLLSTIPQDNKDDNVAKTNSVPITLWILSAIGSLGFIITIFLLVVISRIKSRIDERKYEIGELEKKVLKQKEELLVLINRPQPVADKSIKKTKIPNISESPIEKTKPVVVTDKKEQKQPPQPVQEKSSVYYLFATAKAGSSYPEFYNVSRDKTLYKVYMLMLKNEEDEIAEFTIVPDMTPDFMKSVIDDRETHLPPIFCERSIDAQNPTRIEVVSTGIAKKEGGKWTVQERMKIKLV